MSHSIRGGGRHPGRLASALAGCLVLAGPGLGLALNLLDRDRYFRLVQEDGALEWATFFSFLTAGLVFLALARAAKLTNGRIPWFPVVAAMFCWFVAGEEISWGQRLLGLAPPRFFVEHNLQQELSLHNLASGRVHDLAFFAIVLGYGLLLPLGELIAAPRRWASRLGLSAPPIGLVPAFGALLVVHLVGGYWYLEEWTELGLGFAFFFAGLFQLPIARPALAVIGSGMILVGLGSVAATFTGAAGIQDSEMHDLVRAELEALRRDLRTGQLELSCELHKRMRDYHRVTGHPALGSGAFMRVAAGRGTLPGEQFLDPWHMPYWIVVRCPEEDRDRSVLVYSTGPNRRRDSTRWSIEGDDQAVVVLGPDPAARDIEGR